MLGSFFNFSIHKFLFIKILLVFGFSLNTLHYFIIYRKFIVEATFSIIILCPVHNLIDIMKNNSWQPACLEYGSQALPAAVRQVGKKQWANS